VLRWHDGMECGFRLRSWNVSDSCTKQRMIWLTCYPRSDAPTTTDGSCGYSNGGSVCGHWGSGNCCSSSGFCGHTDAYCGGGCQSGDCFTGVPSTDGTCGAAFGDSTCVGWVDGECCSGSGFCGSGDAYCGTGCQSGPCKSGTIVGKEGVRPTLSNSELNANSSCQDLKSTSMPSSVLSLTNAFHQPTKA
jgi:hypothetical protein